MNSCQRAGCTGHYAADGYCDECGHKAAVAVPAQSVRAADPQSSRSFASVASAATGTTGPSGTTRSSRSRSRRHLGANLVVMPPVPLRDPASAVLTDPSVSEPHRTCSKCGELVGQSKDGKPGRTQGFCPRDGTPFSFTPTLRTGDLVSHRYEILGCLAHGGLGWIYLGRDRNISDAGADRWVVLKGLINTGDADAMAAAVAERRFLVEVDHPNIVKIHDFADHVDPVSGTNVGYIVMEYVGGRSLKDLALNHRGANGRREPLPLAQVLAYALEVLPAIGYLHDRDLLFCDFKPDNVIHAGEQLKIIDLGAVRRIDDQSSALYGTPGYQAPELATAGPSIGSDIYTIGRTMAVLSFDFAGFTSRFAEKLPDASTIPLLAAEESYDRLLRRATHAKVVRRFASTSDMADQTMGVLRELLSAADGQPRPWTSGQFTGEHTTFGAQLTGIVSGAEIVAALPVPLVDPTDSGAAFLATLSPINPAATITALRSMTAGDGLEIGFRLVRTLLETHDIVAAAGELEKLRPRAMHDWRISWYAGLIALHGGDNATAVREFDLVYSALPGEIAPRLALAAANELAGDRAAAARRYERVWRVDHAYPSAAFGLARMRAAAGDRTGAIAVLDEVPDSSSQYVSAQVASLRTSIDRAVGAIEVTDLVSASERLERLKLDTLRQATLSIEMYEAALSWLTECGPGTAPATSGYLFGRRLTERDLRLGLERAYRLLATLETDTRARHALVDRANAARPWTMV
ncbi:MAG TPA: tetratricopeptide repeat protein [Micromonosporaceae bacterium]